MKENERCFSVDWTEEELLWITSTGKLWSRRLADNSETAIQLYAVGQLPCMRTSKTANVALLSYENFSLNVRVSPRSRLSEAKSIICRYPNRGPSLTLTNMSVSDTHIAVCDNGKCVVRVFNSSGTEIGQFGAGFFRQPCGVFLHKDSVFVSDLTGRSLYKFKLYDITDNQNPVWVCRDLAKPSGVCVNQNGLIHVASAGSGLIHLISSQGLF